MLGSAGWRVCLLNSFRIERDGEAIDWLGGSRRDELLAYLALHVGEPQGRRETAELFWPDREHHLARNRLSEVLHLVRRFLDELGMPVGTLHADRQVLWLDPSLATDVAEFEQALKRAPLEQDPVEKVRLLGTAVAMHGHGLLPLLQSDWVQPTRARLSAMYDLASELLPMAIRQGGAPALAALPPEAVQLEFVSLVGSQQAGGSVATATAGPDPAVSTRVWDVPEATPDEVPLVFSQLLDELPRRHLQRCVDLVEDAEPELIGPRRAEWMARLDSEYEPICLALDWAAENEEREAGLRLAGGLCRYWYLRGHVDEGRSYLERALQVGQSRGTEAEAKALAGAGAFAADDGDHGLADERLALARSIFERRGNEQGMARTYSNLGLVAHKRGDYEKARAAFGRAISFARDSGSDTWLAISLKAAALTEMADKDYNAAERLLSQRLEIVKSADDKVSVAKTVANLATVAHLQGDMPEARVRAEWALRELERYGDLRGVAFAARALGRIEQESGDLDKARTLYEVSLRIVSGLHDMWGVGECLRYLASVSAAEGDTERAIDYYEKALLALRDSGDERSIALVEASLAKLQPPSPDQGRGAD